jgi:glutamyl-tRNA reductase
VRLRLIDIERGVPTGGRSSVPAAGVVATFRTCVRDLLFLDDNAGASGFPVVEGGAAYTRLVEIVCGLHSSMVGETQVQGQFKTFLEALDAPAHQRLRRLGRQVLTDARTIREAHLRGLGSRTYGSAVRRHSRGCSRVAIIGAGVLAQEIHQYVAETHAVDVWTRARLQQLHLDAVVVPAGVDPTTLVVAAPVDSAAIAMVAASYPALCRIIDLRADDESTPLPSGVPARTLADVFASARTTGAARAKIDAARAAAARCGQRFDAREELRPFGWEDLCA